MKQVNSEWAVHEHKVGLTVPCDCVDLWCVNTDDSGQLNDQLLSDGERSRAERFYSKADRIEWTNCRSALRQILAGYTGLCASTLQFITGVNGKPALSNSDKIHNLEFNVTHTKGLALIAVTIDNAVGIDLERSDRNLDPLELSAAVFSASETAWVLEEKDERRNERFLRIWTMKEAWLKMLGYGLVDDIKGYCVFNRHLLPKVLQPAEIMEIDVATDCQACLAVQKPLDNVRQFKFDVALMK